MPLTSSDLWNLVAQNFGDLGPGAVATMYGIVNAESGGNQYAWNQQDPYGGSFGLAQINGSHGYDPNRLMNDPAYNLAAARQVYDQQGFNAWSTYTSGAYAGGQGAGMSQVTYPAMQTYTPNYPNSGPGGTSFGGPTALYADPYTNGIGTATPYGNGPAGVQQPGIPQLPVGPISTGDGPMPPLTPAQIQALIAAGWTQSEIAQLQDGQSVQTITGQALQQRALDTLKTQADITNAGAVTTGVYPSVMSGGQPGTYSPTLDAQKLLATLSGPADFIKYGNLANSLMGNQQGAVNPWLQYDANLRGGSVPSAPAATQASVPAVPQAGTSGVSPAFPPNLFNAQPQHDATLAASLASQGGTPVIQGQGNDSGLTGFMNQARLQAGVPQLAFGGQSNMAVVGDPQRANQANPELAMSAAPITVVPMNQMPPHLQRFVSQMPHMASGGMLDAPFMQRLQSGGPAFSGSGLGEAWGQQPFSYRNYQQLAPSEQQMLQGYVNTQKSAGGMGGYFPDELARSQQAAFLGSPYQTFYGARGETYG